ncbi:MAG TPA: ABC transporter, partial [Opitutaceae bacterium]|nr:ABC transporter [Opitutaceae bacterium]
YEQELLRRYLSAQAGRLILFVAAGTNPGLRDLLIDDWGVLVDDDLVIDLGSDNMTEDGDLIILAFAQHPITQPLVDYKEPLRIGNARSVRPLPGRPAEAGLTVVTLAATSTTAWGEIDFRQRGIQQFTAGVDIKGLPQMEPPNRLGLAVASEKVAVRGSLPFSVPGGRIVVVGTGDMISNARIINTGSEAFFLGAVNWTVGRDTALNVPARPIDRFQLSLSAGELARMRYTLMLALPGIAALLGIAVYWARRT